MSDPLPNPGRRAAVDELTCERFSRSAWFSTIHPEMPLDDSEFTQGVRRRLLREAIDGTHETEEVA